MKRSVVFILSLLIGIGMDAQRVEKMSHDIRRLVNQTVSQVRRAPGVRQHETVRAMIRFNGNAETVMGEYGCKAITQIGDIYVADIPVSQLKAMVNDERVNSQGTVLNESVTRYPFEAWAARSTNHSGRTCWAIAC